MKKWWRHTETFPKTLWGRLCKYGASLIELCGDDFANAMLLDMLDDGIGVM